MSFVQEIKDKFSNRGRRRRRGLKKQPKRSAPRRERSSVAESRQGSFIGNLVSRGKSTQASSTTTRRRKRQFWGPLRNRSEAARDIIGSTRWVSAMILLMCVVILYKATTNSRFLLDNISVSGVEFLPADVVIEASGLSEEHIFVADPNSAIENIELLPGVDNAKIVVQWPDTVAIRVEEDTPVMIWEEAGVGYWVNGSGEISPIVDTEFGLLRIIANVPAAPAPTPTPTVDPESADEDLVVEKTVDRPNTYLSFVPDDIMLGALSLQSEISRTQGVVLDTLVYEIHGGLSYQDQGGWKAWAGPSGDVPIVTPGGWRVYFGTDKDMATKVAMYNAIVANLLDRGITPAYVNVSSIDRPFYMPALGSDVSAGSNEG